MTDSTRFWETTPLAEMSSSQWESLCDGCARCCLHKIEDEATLTISYTDVACELLDLESCRCTDYANRKTRVPSCLHISIMSPETFRWLPDSCAYRLLFEGKPLFEWHPLISGSAQSVIDAGISVKDECMAEAYIHPDEISLRRAHWVTCSELPVIDE